MTGVGAEARLNSYPQFTTEIDGQPIHFLHVESGHPSAKPLLITHGYPSSVAEFLHLIEPLVAPAAGQAFHIVASSLRGYAFSTPLSVTGWSMGRTARAWIELMRQLGYQRYGVLGGDVGSGVSGLVAGLDCDHVIGMHVVTDPLTAANTATFLPGMAERLDASDPVDKLILDRMEEFRKRRFRLPRDRDQPPNCCSASLPGAQPPRTRRAGGRPRSAGRPQQAVLPGATQACTRPTPEDRLRARPAPGCRWSPRCSRDLLFGQWRLATNPQPPVRPPSY